MGLGEILVFQAMDGETWTFNDDGKMSFYCSMDAVSKRYNNMQVVWRYASRRKHYPTLQSSQDDGIESQKCAEGFVVDK